MDAVFIGSLSPRLRRHPAEGADPADVRHPAARAFKPIRCRWSVATDFSVRKSARAAPRRQQTSGRISRGVCATRRTCGIGQPNSTISMAGNGRQPHTTAAARHHFKARPGAGLQPLPRRLTRSGDLDGCRRQSRLQVSRSCGTWRSLRVHAGGETHAARGPNLRPRHKANLLPSSCGAAAVETPAPQLERMGSAVAADGRSGTGGHLAYKERVAGISSAGMLFTSFSGAPYRPHWRSFC